MRAVKRARAQGRCVCGWLVTYAVYSSPVGRTRPYYLASCYLASRLVRFSVRGRAAVVPRRSGFRVYCTRMGMRAATAGKAGMAGIMCILHLQLRAG